METRAMCDYVWTRVVKTEKNLNTIFRISPQK